MTDALVVIMFMFMLEDLTSSGKYWKGTYKFCFSRSRYCCSTFCSTCCCSTCCCGCCCCCCWFCCCYFRSVDFAWIEFSLIFHFTILNFSVIISCCFFFLYLLLSKLWINFRILRVHRDLVSKEIWGQRQACFQDFHNRAVLPEVLLSHVWEFSGNS